MATQAVFLLCGCVCFFLRLTDSFFDVFVDDSGNIAPAVGKLKTKLNDLSNALRKCTNFFAYEFPPVQVVNIPCLWN